MKKTLTSIFLLLTGSTAIAQVVSTMATENSNVRYYASDNGTFFNDPANNLAGYIIPKDSNTRAIYTMALRAMGADVNGQLKGAIADYNESDFFPGPIAADYTVSSYTQAYGFALWDVTKAEVDYHLQHWQDAGYVPAANLQEWPGNGNVLNYEAAVLAPFFDMNNDLVYNPTDGDYPLIRGDKAIFSILNDQRGMHPSGAEPIGLEVHLLLYQFDNAQDPTLTNTTFVNATLFNRGVLVVNDFHFGTFIDFDLGGFNDDYIGTMPEKNLAYVYNADLNDGPQSGLPGFGEYPPAVGVMSLTEPLYSHVDLTSGTPSTGLPSTPAQHSNVLQGLDRFGATLLDGDGLPTRFSWNEAGEAGWNEYTEMNPPGDRKSQISFKPVDFAPGDILCYDLAVIYAPNPDGTLFGSVDSLGQAADYIQEFFDDQQFTCENPEVTGIAGQELVTIDVYPNPAADVLHIAGLTHGDFRIVTPDGKTVQTGSMVETIDVSRLDTGFYLLTVSADGQEGVVSFMKR